MTFFTVEDKVATAMEFFNIPEEFRDTIFVTIAATSYKRQRIAFSGTQLTISRADFATHFATDKKWLYYYAGEPPTTEDQENFLLYLDIEIERRPKEFCLKGSKLSDLEPVVFWRGIDHKRATFSLCFTSKQGRLRTVPFYADESVETIIARFRAGDPKPELATRIDDYLERHLSAHALSAITEHYAEEELLEVQDALDSLMMSGNSVAFALRNILDQDELRARRKT